MSAYMVILAEVHDWDTFKAYAVAVSELVGEFGGKYIVRGGAETECLEGDWPDETRCVISEWPSMEAARTFWNSDAYREIKKLRQGNSTARVRIIEGPSA